MYSYTSIPDNSDKLKSVIRCFYYLFLLPFQLYLKLKRQTNKPICTHDIKKQNVMI